MSVTNPVLTSTRTNQSLIAIIQRIVGYTMCVALGAFSGIVSTALVMIVAIMLQAFLLSTQTFEPGIVFYTGVAIAIGAGTAWVLGYGGRTFLPNLFNRADGYEISIILTVGTLVSLIQTISFIFIL